MALEIQMERMRASEAMSARDSAVQRLASAYDSIKSKANMITTLTGEKFELEIRLRDAERRAAEAEERLKELASGGGLVGSNESNNAADNEEQEKEIERLKTELNSVKNELDALRALNMDSVPPHIHASVDVDVISPSPTLILDVNTVSVQTISPHHSLILMNAHAYSLWIVFPMISTE